MNVRTKSTLQFPKFPLICLLAIITFIKLRPAKLANGWRRFNSPLTITMTSQWERCRLKSPASLLFTQPFIQGADQIKHQSSASLAILRRKHRWPLNSPHKGPVTRKMFPFDDVIMHTWSRMRDDWLHLTLIMASAPAIHFNNHFLSGFNFDENFVGLLYKF